MFLKVSMSEAYWYLVITGQVQAPSAARAPSRTSHHFAQMIKSVRLSCPSIPRRTTPGAKSITDIGNDHNSRRKPEQGKQTWRCPFPVCAKCFLRVADIENGGVKRCQRRRQPHRLVLGGDRVAGELLDVRLGPATVLAMLCVLSM